MKPTREEWKRAERNQHLGYNGHSERMKCRHGAEAQKKEEDFQLHNRWVKLLYEHCVLLNIL